MDYRFVEYVKTLHARGYTLEQISTILAQESIDAASIHALLTAAGLEQTVATNAQTIMQTGANQTEHPNDSSLQQYVTYVRAMLANGTSQSAIEQDLASRGADPRTITTLLQLARQATPYPQTGQVAPPGVTVLSAASVLPVALTKPSAGPGARQVQTQPAGLAALPAQIDNTATQPTGDTTKSHYNAERTVLLHSDEEYSGPRPLTKLRHWVRSVNEISEVGAEAITAASGPEKPESSLPAAVEHLNKVADHLESVANMMEKEVRGLAANGPDGNVHAASVPAMSNMSPAQSLAATSSRPAAVPFPWPASTPNPLPAASAAPPVTAPVAAKPIRKDWLVATAVIYAVVLGLSLRTGHKSVTWLALLSMNVFGTVAYNLLLKRSEWKKVDQWVTAAVMQTGLAIPFLIKEIIWPIHFPAFTPFELLLMGYCVIALITMQICNVKSLQYLEASVYSVVFNSRIILATLFGAFFLSEAIGIWALAGGLIIFAAIFVVRQKSTKSIAKLGVMYGLGAAFAMSSMNTCEKELIKLVGWPQYVFPVWATAALLMWLIVRMRRTPIPLRMIVHPQGLTMMSARAFAGIGFTASLMFGPVAVSSYVSSLSVVFLVIFGMLYFGEWDYLKSKVIATILSILGLTFILFDGLR